MQNNYKKVITIHFEFYKGVDNKRPLAEYQPKVYDLLHRNVKDKSRFVEKSIYFLDLYLKSLKARVILDKNQLL